MVFKDYRTTSPFGYRTHPITGKRSFHTGIDLVKNKGGKNAPIEAFTGGTVLFSGMGRTGSGFGGYGNVVLIKDKNNRGQVYAHLNSVSVKKGQTISKGQVIGRQGTTGNSTGEHLHYEVRKTAQNSAPYGWIADRANNCLDPTDYLKGFNHASSSTSDGRVVEIQKWVGSTPDGIPGPDTWQQLTKKLQSELNKQFNAGLKVDGIWGPKTRAAIITIRNGATGNLTRVLQSALYLAGYTEVGKPDGVFGDKTYKALGNFQNATDGLKLDRAAGRETFTKLFA